MNILVLAPHTDDEVIGCGGLIHNRVKQGDYVKVIAFSHIFNKKTLSNEFKSAAKVLKTHKYDFFDFEARHFDFNRQKIRDVMVELRNEKKWDWILVPQRNDPHQDHQVITEEAIRIFNKYTLLGYEGPAKSRRPIFDLVVKLTKKDITAKVKAFLKFKSQQKRFYYQKDFFFGRAIDRGALIETKFAEAFEVIRMTL